MQLSCLPVSLYQDLSAGKITLEDWFRLDAALGLDGADVSVAHIRSRADPSLDMLRRQAGNCGVRVIILAAYPDFTHPDPGQRAREADDLRGWIAAAERLGASFVRVTAGQAHPGIPEDAALGWASEGLTACLADARAAGVRLLYENHVRGSVWQHNDFSQPSARFLEIVRRTEGSGLEILFDTANCLALDEDPLVVLQAVRHRLGAVHMSDLRRRGTFEPTTIGTGAAPIRETLADLVAGGFDGWISIEEASRTGEEGFRRAVPFADRAWVEAGGRPRAGR
jgi:sugar phosphate isomerase/epimerase